MKEQELAQAEQEVRNKAITVAQILKGSEYSLALFSADEIAGLEFYEKNGKPYLTCIVSTKPRPAKPEEIVRQLFLRKLIRDYGYPRERIALEKKSTSARVFMRKQPI